MSEHAPHQPTLAQLREVEVNGHIRYQDRETSRFVSNETVEKARRVAKGVLLDTVEELQSYGHEVEKSDYQKMSSELGLGEEHMKWHSGGSAVKVLDKEKIAKDIKERKNLSEDEAEELQHNLKQEQYDQMAEGLEPLTQEQIDSKTESAVNRRRAKEATEKSKKDAENRVQKRAKEQSDIDERNAERLSKNDHRQKVLEVKNLKSMGMSELASLLGEKVNYKKSKGYYITEVEKLQKELAQKEPEQMETWQAKFADLTTPADKTPSAETLATIEALKEFDKDSLRAHTELTPGSPAFERLKDSEKVEIYDRLLDENYAKILDFQAKIERGEEPTQEELSELSTLFATLRKYSIEANKLEGLSEDQINDDDKKMIADFRARFHMINIGELEDFEGIVLDDHNSLSVLPAGTFRAPGYIAPEYDETLDITTLDGAINNFLSLSDRSTTLSLTESQKERVYDSFVTILNAQAGGEDIFENMSADDQEALLYAIRLKFVESSDADEQSINDIVNSIREGSISYYDEHNQNDGYAIKYERANTGNSYEPVENPELLPVHLPGEADRLGLNGGVERKKKRGFKKWIGMAALGLLGVVGVASLSGSENSNKNEAPTATTSVENEDTTTTTTTPEDLSTTTTSVLPEEGSVGGTGNGSENGNENESVGSEDGSENVEDNGNNVDTPNPPAGSENPSQPENPEQNTTILEVKAGDGFQSLFQRTYDISNEQAFALYQQYADQLAKIAGTYVQDGGVRISAPGELDLGSLKAQIDASAKQLSETEDGLPETE